ncbi:MAG TPA: aldo/keto reductase [Pseudogracilibacillus sp.]|nr:aldo/keto reductase [Pseudogracilibacillus sp.]
MSRKVAIRSTDLMVNPVGLGTNAVGGQKYYPHMTDDAGRKILHAALEEGIDFWDTAYTYGPKRSEEIIGEVLEETGRRQDVVLASKAAHETIDGKTTFNNSPSFLKQAVEDSLKRLRTDYIDLFYIHFPDEVTPKYEAIGALKELKDEGKIRAIGVSNFSLQQLEEANQDGYVNVYQGKYNLLDRSIEQSILPYTLEHDISFVPYFPLASGLLAGKYDESTSFAEGDLRLKQADFQGERFKAILRKVEQLRDIAVEKEVEVAQLVLAIYLHHKAIDVIIPGAKKAEQITHNARTATIKLSKDEINKIYDIFS